MMTPKVIEYTSGSRLVNTSAAMVLETFEKGGIKHTWSGYEPFALLDISSSILVKAVGLHRVEIDWTEANQSISAALGSGYSSYWVTFKYHLTAHFAEMPPPEKISYDEMFAASDMTDMVLIVQGKKLNVNKTFLSIHSDYFKTLFSSNFKEGQMKEIEIKEVSYNDFGLLSSSFYPNQQFPNNHTVEKLLEMASRFQVSSVIGIVEYHLLNNSKIGYEKMIWMADEYVMPKLDGKEIEKVAGIREIVG
ncbi:unnamed protein product [Caenorhabditis nigoni]